MSKELFSLGEIYPSDFLAEGQESTTEKVELKLIMDDDGLVRLEKVAPMNKMYGKYWYRSGINTTMKDALKDVVDSVLKVQKLDVNDMWVDIACNDGTLLSYLPNNLFRVGVDPADDTYKAESSKHSDLIIQDFFTAKTFKEQVWNKKAKVVTSIAMFYDVPDPKKFIKDVYDILEDDGLWVMQLSYSPMMMAQNAFDNICHEHIYYYSLCDLIRLMDGVGFDIIDAELNNVNGGSIRAYMRKGKMDGILETPADFRVSSLIAFEKERNIERSYLWSDWYDQGIELLKSKTVSFIKQAKSEGKTIWGYGASTKGNTLLQYFGLDNTLIDAIADRNPSKHGLRCIGSNIPIKSEEEMREAQPDYLLILPWHFINEFKDREKYYLSKGGKFIVPCPQFQIISA